MLTGVMRRLVQLPYTPDPGDDPAHQEEHHRYLALRKVRHTILRLLGDDFRRPAGSHRSWQDCDLDLNGITIDASMNFACAAFTDGVVVSFDGATFADGSTVSFNSAAFSDGAVSFDGAMFSGGTVVVHHATFSNSRVSFEGATFAGGSVAFDGALFSSGSWLPLGTGPLSSGGTGGYVGIPTPSSGVVWARNTPRSDVGVFFHHATFAGGSVSFDGAAFDGGTVSFDDATGPPPAGCPQTSELLPLNRSSSPLPG
ncbi:MULTISPECIES: hypothetical protein [unclassified Streptomyces]|uniref:hypothetical protein n=1 Tax=unclassified Streptomyces TaxID=2593676 RepID=UPI0035DC5E7F